MKKTHLVAVPDGMSRARHPTPERRLTGDDVLRSDSITVNAGSKREWMVVYESDTGQSTVIALVYQIGNRFEVTIMSDPLRMASVVSVAAAVDLLATDGATVRQLRAAMRWRPHV
ncbi:hypothetical protein E3T55_00520 [Cryobacterium frigoriphilum]|uniref:Uncharacterized protein n=1 Tax=Cryobacterium frigoriphilum TaxID=1259150 RepID=A0A4R9AB73_9MICO|nr:hypothetical protein [Cryobacterium frigoriphilum]TFD55842.1 hypothetical protein E3T55_00520 [Cryobacterium frigoriphilum]